MHVQLHNGKCESLLRPRNADLHEVRRWLPRLDERRQVPHWTVVQLRCDEVRRSSAYVQRSERLRVRMHMYRPGSVRYVHRGIATDLFGRQQLRPPMLWDHLPGR